MCKNSFEDFNGIRTPGYPLFIALIYWIASGKVWVVLLIQILLSLISVGLVYKIAALFFSKNISLLSSLLFAIDLNQAVYTITIMTETLFVLLFLASIYYLCKYIKSNNYFLIILSSIFLGLATLVRPISYYFPIPIIIFLLFLSVPKLSTKLKHLTLFIIFFAATISPWILHNYSKYDELKFTSMVGYDLLFWNVAYTEVYKTGDTIDQVRTRFYDLAVKHGIDTTDDYSIKNSRIFENIAQKYIKENFFLYCRRSLMGVINMYAGLSTQQIAQVFHLKSDTLKVSQFWRAGYIHTYSGFL